MRYEQKADLQDSNKARMYEEKKKKQKGGQMSSYMIDLSKYNLDELIEIKQKVEDEISSYYARRRRKYEEQQANEQKEG